MCAPIGEACKLRRIVSHNLINAGAHRFRTAAPSRITQSSIDSVTFIYTQYVYT
jgi:hypothetical protein